MAERDGTWRGCGDAVVFDLWTTVPWWGNEFLAIRDRQGALLLAYGTAAMMPTVGTDAYEGAEVPASSFFAPLELATSEPCEPDCEEQEGGSGFITDPCPCETRLAIDFTVGAETVRLLDRGSGTLPLAGLSLRVDRAVRANFGVGQCIAPTDSPGDVVPLAWDPAVDGTMAIEVYPAATLAARSFVHRGYKGGSGAVAFCEARIGGGTPRRDRVHGGCRASHRVRRHAACSRVRARRGGFPARRLRCSDHNRARGGAGRRVDLVSTADRGASRPVTDLPAYARREPKRQDKKTATFGLS